MARIGGGNRTRVGSPPGTRPLLVFDGECGFCRRWIERWRAATGERVDYAPYQEVAERFPEVPHDAFERAIQLVDTDGTVYSGAEAALRALATVPGRGAALLAYRRVPGFAAVAERVYRAVAAHRTILSRLTLRLWGASVVRPEWRLARDVFLRLLGVVYLVAFVSLGSQVEGLVGSRGVLPAAPFLAEVGSRLGAERFWLLPTLCWLDSSDVVLRILCWGGAAASVLVIGGLLTAPALAAAWISYLSLAVVCRTFLGFQWDALLLEAGFLAIFAAPIGLRCRLPCADPPARAPLWLLRWLLFRLLLSSGVVKLTSGDPTWRSLSALDFHYWTQPLPTRVGWYAHLLPGWAQSVSVLGVFAGELVVPFLIFAPRRPRWAGFWGIVGFQGLIALTGNYAFFNLLTASLAVLLLDDEVWPGRIREWLARARARETGRASRRWPAPVTALLVVALFPASLAELQAAFGARLPGTAPLEAADRLLAPLRVVNGYGLFAVMTTARPEIVLEGSEDGRSWLPYGFRWKPGDPARAPHLVAPFQPRLDWQMWFAALGDYRANPWMRALLQRLLEGAPQVVSLLGSDPFPASPPRYVRAVLYLYRPTDWTTHRRTGAWWTREEIGPYSPVLRR